MIVSGAELLLMVVMFAALPVPDGKASGGCCDTTVVDCRCCVCSGSPMSSLDGTTGLLPADGRPCLLGTIVGCVGPIPLVSPHLPTVVIGVSEC